MRFKHWKFTLGVLTAGFMSACNGGGCIDIAGCEFNIAAQAEETVADRYEVPDWIEQIVPTE